MTDAEQHRGWLLALDIYSIVWRDGPQTEHTADTLAEIVDAMIRRGYGPTDEEEEI